MTGLCMAMWPGFRAHRDFEVAAGPQLMENHLVVGVVPKNCCRYPLISLAR